jgi:hypothetical protein
MMILQQLTLSGIVRLDEIYRIQFHPVHPVHPVWKFIADKPD